MANGSGAAAGERAIATLSGWLVYQPELSYAPLRKESAAASELRVNDQRIPVVAYGEIAKELSSTPKGAFLVVNGDIAQHVWRVGGADRSKFCVEITEVVSCKKPQICFTRSAAQRRRS